MFTKTATIFTFIKIKRWKLGTIILIGLQTLCENFKYIAIVGFEIWSVKERYGRGGSGRFTSKIAFRDKINTFFHL